MSDPTESGHGRTWQLVTVPSYRLITLRDQDNDAATGADEAIERARHSIAASTGYELYIECVQDIAPVSVLVALRAEAATDAADGYTSAGTYQLECPSGQLALGSPTGDAIAIELEPGMYRAMVTHRGRTAMAERHREILHLADSATELRERANNAAGLEEYRIAMWRTGELLDAE
jgi:hypothetical protein